MTDKDRLKYQQRTIERLKDEMKALRFENTMLRRNIIDLTAGNEVQDDITSENDRKARKLIRYLNLKFKTDITAKNRMREIVTARMMFYHWMCFNTSMTLTAMSLSLGCHHHHSTVIHARDTFEGLLMYDKKINQDYTALRSFMSNEINEDELVINAS